MFAYNSVITMHLESNLFSKCNLIKQIYRNDNLLDTPILNCNQRTYQAVFGSNLNDLAYGLTEDESGNIYISGGTYNFGNEDGFLSKFNKYGDLIWYKTYGGTEEDYFQKHVVTSDKGLLLLGCSKSYGVGGGDVWIVKVDSSGSVLWSKTVGGTSVESAWYATVAIDSGYFVYGNTYSYGSGGADNYLIRLNKKGDLKWTKTYGNNYFNDLKGLTNYPDGNSIYCSNYATSSSADALLAMIDSVGNILWSFSFGGEFNDGLYTLTKDGNGNIYIAGFVRSSPSNQEMFVASFTSNGNKRWMKMIEGNGNDALYNIEISGDEILLNGHTNSYGFGNIDGSFIRMDTTGNLIFAKTIGGANDDYLFSCLKSNDSSYYAIGYSASFSNNDNQIFLNKLNCIPYIGCNEIDYLPQNIDINLKLINEEQDTSSGGIFNSQFLTAVKRNISVSYLCRRDNASEINLSSECEIYIPNTFTPVNSLGINDEFRPIIPKGCEPIYYKFDIYNRWGELVFTTNDYNEGWKGEYKGKRISNGNYVWIMTVQHPYMNKGNIFKRTGNILIID